MYPKVLFDETHCLESLVGIRTGCSVTEKKPFWIEDIEGVDVKTLSALARSSHMKGTEYAKSLINSSAREMLGDIQLMLANGYRMKDIVGDLCSSCTMLPVYTANTGIVIKTLVASRVQVLRVTRLTVLVNRTGELDFWLDDGVTPKMYTADFIAGDLMPIDLNYQTAEKSVKIYFDDPTVPLGQVTCPSSGAGCGCGSTSSANLPVQFVGLNNGNEVSTMYGFLACATVSCSYDALVCNLIKQTPNIFGVTLLYKIAEKWYVNKISSNRNNEVASYNEEPKDEFMRNYGRLYASHLHGSNGKRGVRNIVNDYLKTVRADKCVICDSKINTAYASG